MTNNIIRHLILGKKYLPQETTYLYALEKETAMKLTVLYCRATKHSILLHRVQNVKKSHIKDMKGLKFQKNVSLEIRINVYCNI